jgi:hypothetical protein
MPKRNRPSYVPAGEYEVTVVNATSQISRNGNEMVVLKLSVEGGRGTIFDHLVFTEEADWRIASFLTAVGIELGQGDAIDPALFVDRRARALVKVEPFDGRFQNKIEKWLHPKDGADEGGAKSPLKKLLPPKRCWSRSDAALLTPNSA